MNLFFYILSIIGFFLYVQTSNYFYYIFFHENIHRKRFVLIIFIQILGAIIYPYLKSKSALQASGMSYTLFFLSSFLYGISLKDRLIYYLFLIAINICGEMISSSCLMFIFSFIFNVDKIFLDTILKTNQIYYLIGLISAVLSVFLVIKYIESISKNVANKQLKQIIKICFLPLVLVFTTLNIIYATDKNTFMIAAIGSWIIVISASFIIVKGINKYQILQKESIKNKAKQEILNLQIEDMTTIDQHYRNIRRGNHDFKNHCLVVLNMLKSHDENVKEYLLSMKDSYQSEESKK